MFEVAGKRGQMRTDAYTSTALESCMHPPSFWPSAQQPHSTGRESRSAVCRPAPASMPRAPAESSAAVAILKCSGVEEEAQPVGKGGGAAARAAAGAQQ